VKSLSEIFGRVKLTASGVAHELTGAYRLTADPASFLRLGTDVLLSRLARVLPRIDRERERSIRVRGNVQLFYRLNRGDMQSIREVWIDECYRLPFDVAPTRVVDLGANIGLTSLWFAHRYGCSTIIAVEPSPSNARLTRLNLERNGVNAEVVEAAVGPRDGTGFFAAERDSNLGRLQTAGRAVPIVSMATLLSKLPEGAEVDLLKLDIEGGEEALLKENVLWLRRVKAIIAEFHPDVIDYPAAIRAIEQQGFRYIPAHSAADFDSMDAFVRQEVAAT
jgi:FkbM family methyltransferase